MWRLVTMMRLLVAVGLTALWLTLQISRDATPPDMSPQLALYAYS
jgi:hypothetical protein